MTAKRLMGRESGTPSGASPPRAANPGRLAGAPTRMGLLGTIVATLAVLFVALLLGLQVLVRYRARAMNGAPVPELPGELGGRITRSGHSLVYFFSPGCAACRAITPRIRALEKDNSHVFAVDVTHAMDLAQSLKVMATPSLVEIENGTITGYHVGQVPEAVMTRFAVG
jgi:thiol-disulfide isomerase/thioredoxin